MAEDQFTQQLIADIRHARFSAKTPEAIAALQAQCAVVYGHDEVFGKSIISRTFCSVCGKELTK